MINKPRLEVWAFMTDPDNVPLYSSNVVDYELISGEKQEVGRICRWVVKVAGRRLEMTDEMVKAEKGRGGEYISKDATIPWVVHLIPARPALEAPMATSGTCHTRATSSSSAE